MKNALGVVITSLVTTAIFIGVYYFVLLPNQPDVSFMAEESIEPSLDIHEILQGNQSGYRILNTSTGTTDDVMGLVGMVAAIDVESDELSWIGDYRPAENAIKISPIDEKIYQGIVTSKISANGTSTAFSLGMEDEDVAELIIRNTLSLTHKDSTQIPWQELRKIAREVNYESKKQYWYVDSVILSTIDYRTFKKSQGSNEVAGVAFSAKGNIYSSSEGFRSQKKLILRLIALNPLRPSEGAGSNARLTADVLRVLRQPIINDEEDADILIEYLRGFDDELPLDLQNTKPISKRSNAYNREGMIVKYDDIIWDVKIDNIPLLRQEKNNDCWAVVSSMLYATKNPNINSVETFFQIASVDNHWKKIYQEDRGIFDSKKEAFLINASFAFDYGMSYFPVGISKLLKNKGPIWVTVGLDNAFNKHASVLTGISVLMPNDKYYISYIDPYYGHEFVETYASFMYRYENIAQYDNYLFGSEIQNQDVVPIHVSYLNLD